ncbi:MAG TPA: hypothetical protein VI894_03290 [Candidatus Nanoarchaeia archaeon]|nr:hypothetical protein [Candidatus Nanoarchaeia archaeon]
MAEDIPRTTILILIILTVVISVLGTWTVMNSAKAGGGQQVSIQGPSAVGTAELTIVKPSPPQTSTTEGTASLTVTK